MTENRYYRGPVTDHFDGTRFSNFGRSSDKNLLDVLRWRLRSRRTPWPARVPLAAPDRPPARSTPLRASFIGHGSLLLQMADLNILVDPVWSERVSPFRRFGPRRVVEPGIRFEDLPRIDAVLLTHNHYDHLDLATIGRLQERFGPRVVTPLGNDAVIHAAIPQMRVDTGDWGDRFDLGNGIEVALHPANHWSARGLRDRRMALWCGFAIATPEGLLYHSGDTGYGDGSIFRDLRTRFGAPALAFLPIGAYEPRWFMRDQHVAPDEAVRILLDTGARRALGFHWGTFPLADEGMETPEADLRTALAAAGLPPERFRAMRPGEVFGLHDGVAEPASVQNGESG